MANFATFRIKRVKCRDEMGGSFRENFGNDEIKCAVFSADLRGSTVNSGRIDIYADFDDGDQKVFDPPREVVSLDLAGAPGEVELSFSVLLIESQLREGDGLKKAWEAFVKIYEESLKDKLKTLRLSNGEARTMATPGYLKTAESRRWAWGWRYIWNVIVNGCFNVIFKGFPRRRWWRVWVSDRGEFGCPYRR